MKKEHAPQQVKDKLKLAKQVALHHFKKGIRGLEFKPAGITNFVFEVRTTKGDFIIRIARNKTKYSDFIKEQWINEKVKGKKIPVPDILVVDKEVIGLPYMIQEKTNGSEAVDHPNRLEILKELGYYAKLIHAIPTEGFGEVFNWSDKMLNKSVSWASYIEQELDDQGALRFLRSYKLLNSKKLTQLGEMIERMKGWKVQPCLNHSDLRLKNVIVNDKGKIQAIIDWENANSNAAPYWDLSIALHDLSLDGKQKFLEGYGPDLNELNKNGFAFTVFNLLNYIPHLRSIIKKNNQKMLSLYRLRLNGTLDLFSL